MHRLATVPLSPNHSSYLTGRPAWLAYDSADHVFYVAVPPSSVVVVPGDFGYNPLVVATIPVGLGPFGVAYDNVTGDVFVTNSGSNNVSVIAGSSARLVATVPVGTGPMGVAFDPVDREVLVANNGSNNVSIISDTTLAVVATVAVGTTPIGVAADPSTGDVFVANHGSSNLSVISGSTHTIVATVGVPAGPYGVAVDDKLHRTYVSESTASNVSAVSDSTFAVLANISVTCNLGCWNLNLQGLAYDSGNGLVYVGAGPGTVVVILPTNNSVAAELNFDPAGVAYDPDTGDVCVTNTANATFECAIFGPPSGGPYSVTFSETGLPAGTQWSAGVETRYGTSTGTTLAISVANGSFPFTVEWTYATSPVYYPDPASGLVTVVGANVTVPIRFAAGTFLVKVVETGLPSGSSWSAELGSGTATTASTTNWFNVSNGTYDLAVGQVSNYAASPITRTVTVSGSALVVNVTYAGAVYPRYSVTFSESGLVVGTSWGVTLGGVSRTTSAHLLAFSESNDTYNYTVVATGYNATPSSGVVTVHGGPVAQNVSFVGTAFWKITFRETGLPAGTDWGVLVGGEAQSSTTSDVTFLRQNGTYGFLVFPETGFVATSPGSVVVNGSSPLVIVRFLPQLYPIVFIELGLPAGTNWSVTVTDNATGYNQTQNSTTSSIIFFLPNGTYSVSFGLPVGYRGNASATTVTVAGRPATGATVSVGAPRTPPPPGTPSDAGFALFLLVPILAVGALLVLLVVLRSRRRPPERNRPAG